MESYYERDTSKVYFTTFNVFFIEKLKSLTALIIVPFLSLESKA